MLGHLRPSKARLHHLRSR